MASKRSVSLGALQRRSVAIGVIAAVLVGAAIVLSLFVDPLWVRCTLVGVMLAIALGVLLLVRSHRQLNKCVVQGMQMLEHQDYSSCIAPVGVGFVDGAIELFNRMLLGLRRQRIENREQENFLQQLLQASPMGVVIFDYDHRVSQLNTAACRLLEVQNERDVVGHRLAEVPSFCAMGLDTIREGAPQELHIDSQRIYRCTLNSFLQQGFRRQFLSVEVLTEVVRAAERKSYERVVRTCAHEVNNTTGSVQSVLESTLDWLEEVPESGLYREALETISGRLRNLTEFMRRTAEVAKVPFPRKARVEVGAFLREVVRLTEMQSGREGVEVRVEMPTAEAYVAMDAVLMQRVMQNALQNAYESFEGMGRGGAIVVQYVAQGKGQIVVADNGCPLAEDARSKVFLPFFTTKRQGHGLGLALCQEILSQHGFAYSLRTEDDGWTRFRVTF